MRTVDRQRLLCCKSRRLRLNVLVVCSGSKWHLLVLRVDPTGVARQAMQPCAIQLVTPRVYAAK